MALSNGDRWRKRQQELDEADHDEGVRELMQELTSFLSEASTGPVDDITLPFWGTSTACSKPLELVWYSRRGSMPPSVGEISTDEIDGAFELMSCTRNDDQDSDFPETSPKDTAPGYYLAYDVTYQVHALLNERELEELHMEEHWEAQGDRSRDQVDALVGCSMAELGAARYPVGGES